MRMRDASPAGVPGILASRAGFTLVEMLLVITIIGMLAGVSIPVSYSMYQSYRASVKSQEVLAVVSDLRREAFLYSEEKTLDSVGGRLVINGTVWEALQDVRVSVQRPFKFFSNGATNGGVLEVEAFGRRFLITVDSPGGDISIGNGA